jgi:hypothetical protein
MTEVWKLTAADYKTRAGETNEIVWGPGVMHTAPGGGELCTSAWIHAYEDPLLAALFDPIHGDYGADAVLWRCEGEIGAREILIFIIVVGLLFPGSSAGGRFEFMMIPVVIICGAVLLAFAAGTMYAAAYITTALGGDLGTFMLSWIAVVVASGLANKFICEWIDRRKARHLPAA